MSSAAETPADTPLPSTTMPDTPMPDNPTPDTPMPDTPMPDTLTRCADTARDRQDSPIGTAPPTRRWLLIEHPGPWRIDAVLGAGFPPGVREELSTAANAAQARILLIRRPGRPVLDRRAPYQQSRAWAVSIGGAGTFWGRWRAPEDLGAAADALARSVADLGGNADPVLLICTHGIHDTCCAVRGRPVAAALARRWAGSTWECSHVGGDRFAANVIVLPDGVYYGNLSPLAAVQTVKDHLGGRVTAAFLRGLANLPPVAQAAVGNAHQRYGPLGVNDVLVHRIEHIGADRWLIDLVIADGPATRLRLQSTVQTSARPPARLTCRAPLATSAVAYDVIGVRELPDLT